MSKLTNIAARNIRPGDMFKSGDREMEVLRVRRVDWEDRIEIEIVLRDNSTWVPSERGLIAGLHWIFQVRKPVGPRSFMSWAPVYSDKTNKRKPIPKFC